MSAAVHDRPWRELVIVGRDVPVWLSACLMQQALGPAGVNVKVVELPPRVQAADVCISLPALEALHARLRIDEARVVGGTRGAFSLGRRFTDVSGCTRSFFHAHGSIGTRIDRKEFLPQWLHARRLGFDLQFEEFSLTAQAALQGRMLLPDSDIDGFGFTDYAYHLPALPYGAWLRQLALRRGVHTVAARAVEVRLNAQHAISELLLDGERRISGDFFLDVTGSEALLASKLDTAQESWRAAFPADRVLSACAAPLSPLPAYAEVRAQPEGWTALAASQECSHVQQAYCSELLPDASAHAVATRATGMALQDVVIRVSHPRRRLNAWVNNCVAMGEAACVFDPLHFLDLHAVQVGLVHLLPLFPVQADFTVERVEYNHNVRSAFERMRDFQVAHYHLNGYFQQRGAESLFWSRARAVAPGSELAHKIDAFRARGELQDYEDEAFNIDDWRSLFIGHGVIPESCDPAVDRTSPELLKDELQRIRAFMRRKVDQQRTHTEYLQTVCAPRMA